MTDSSGYIPPKERPLRALSDQELITRYMLFSLMNKGMANNGLSMLEKVNQVLPLTKGITSNAFRSTAGRIFFGGETLEEADVKCRDILARGQGVILDYAAPENACGLSEEHYTKDVPMRLSETIQTCKELKRAFPDATSSLAIKVSTLADYGFLKSVGAKLAHNDDLGIDKAAYGALRERFETLVKQANDAKIIPFIDAEKTEINPLIRDLCFKALDKRLKLSMTLQCYLQETPQVITDILAREYRPDIKLVRGAYMGAGYEDELPHIMENGRPEGKAKTDACYDDSFRRLYGKVDTITAATHNQQSLRTISTLVASHPAYTKVNSATLLAMGDGLETDPKMETLKYVPYGMEMHYFMRRGTEFAMNPVVDESGKTTTRGHVEATLAKSEVKARLNLAEQELKRRAHENPVLRNIIDLVQKNQARDR